MALAFSSSALAFAAHGAKSCFLELAGFKSTVLVGGTVISSCELVNAFFGSVVDLDVADFSLLLAPVVVVVVVVVEEEEAAEG